MGVILGCLPVRGEFVIVIAVWEQVCSSEVCPLVMSVSWRVKIHYLHGNSDRYQACVRCIEGVRISESPLWEVPLYYVKHLLSGVTICGHIPRFH